MGSSKDRMGFRMEFRMVLRYRKIGISRWDSKMGIWQKKFDVLCIYVEGMVILKYMGCKMFRKQVLIFDAVRSEALSTDFGFKWSLFTRLT